MCTLCEFAQARAHNTTQTRLCVRACAGMDGPGFFLSPGEARCLRSTKKDPARRAERKRLLGIASANAHKQGYAWCPERSCFKLQFASAAEATPLEDGHRCTCSECTKVEQKAVQEYEREMVHDLQLTTVLHGPMTPKDRAILEYTAVLVGNGLPTGDATHEVAKRLWTVFDERGLVQWSRAGPNRGVWDVLKTVCTELGIYASDK